MDWCPIGLKLYSFPAKKTNAARISFKVNLQAVLAYNFLKVDSSYYHSPRPGLGIRADFKVQLMKNLSLKFSAFQKGFLPYNRGIDGETRNVMPHLSGVCAGIIIQIPKTIKI